MKNATDSDGVKTTCPYCGVGCGVVAGRGADHSFTTTGDVTHPANFGRLCSKGSALNETLSLESRLLHPEIEGRCASWPEALDRVASDLTRVRDTHGPDAIAFYLSGQLLTEDYYVANKLAKGFIGTPHVDTNSRLCMASSVAGHKRAFGEDIVPQCYDDLEQADLIILAGSNTAWCHPVLYQRIQKARQERGTKVVVIDPRRTATCEGADLHLAITPGTDQHLWNGLFVALADRGRIDFQYIRARTEGFAKALAVARNENATLLKTARNTGLLAADVKTFFNWWCDTEKVVSCYSQGINQSHQGTDKVNAILNCHLATGRIGKVGCGPLSLTGQPNAMGGREVGGLANMLAAHMGFSDAEREIVGTFWDAPNLVTGEGLKAVQMFDAIAEGRIKALWVMGTNPAVSLPRADEMRANLSKLDTLIVSENVSVNDTVVAAGIRLPASAWSEKDGTVTNSERRISRQRGFVEPAGEARPDWWIMQEVAQRLGYRDGFSYTGPAEIFREHARLSGFKNDGERVFNISALADITDQDFNDLEPIQWPVTDSHPDGVARLFNDTAFPTPNGLARLLPIENPTLAEKVSDDWPMLMNTGRIRDQWHTMTRTGLTARLSTHLPEPFISLHPKDAATHDIAANDIVVAETRHGRMVARARLTDDQKPGDVFAPIHWSGTNASDARIGALLTGPADPVSGQPEAKAMPSRISRLPVTFHGRIFSRKPAAPQNTAYWSLAKTSFGTATTFATTAETVDWNAWAAQVLPDGETVMFEDADMSVFRMAVFHDGRLEAVLTVSNQYQSTSPAWLESAFSGTFQTAAERRGVLSGQTLDGQPDEGPIVCVCYQVGANTIATAIASGSGTPEAVGKTTCAGTNCGSCVPELRRLINQTAKSKQNTAAKVVVEAAE
ncbi:MAG: molybdopterin-dependent oxidoreductase [Pseudomonadota bacterium]